MDENALPKPRMPRINNFPFLGPVGVMLSSCIMTPERISRSTRTAHCLVACNFPPRATLLPSRGSAVCIIAMSVEPHETGEAARSSPHQIALNSFLSKDRVSRARSEETHAPQAGRYPSSDPSGGVGPQRAAVPHSTANEAAYSITSSARASSVGGTSRPSILAV